jgi:hypothetical protein
LKETIDFTGGAPQLSIDIGIITRGDIHQNSESGQLGHLREDHIQRPRALDKSPICQSKMGDAFRRSASDRGCNIILEADGFGVPVTKSPATGSGEVEL